MLANGTDVNRSVRMLQKGGEGGDNLDHLRQDINATYDQRMLAVEYRFACFERKCSSSYKRGITPAKNDRLTRATEVRSFPEGRWENISSRTSRFRSRIARLQRW